MELENVSQEEVCRIEGGNGRSAGYEMPHLRKPVRNNCDELGLRPSLAIGRTRSRHGTDTEADRKRVTYASRTGRTKCGASPKRDARRTGAGTRITPTEIARATNQTTPKNADRDSDLHRTIHRVEAFDQPHRGARPTAPSRSANRVESSAIPEGGI